MRALIACEYSGTVREAFRRRGWSAVSCDLLPPDDGSPHHYTGDVRDIIDDEWDIMIAFPPCTHLAVSGARHFHKKRDQQNEALGFISFLMYDHRIPYWAIENPVGIISTRVRKPDQIIQPWQFGHPESKKTCLWHEGLPNLRPTNVLPLPESGRWENQTPSGQNKLGPSPDRWKIRSKTYEGIAEAMADQWGGYVASRLRSDDDRSEEVCCTFDRQGGGV